MRAHCVHDSSVCIIQFICWKTNKTGRMIRNSVWRLGLLVRYVSLFNRVSMSLTCNLVLQHNLLTSFRGCQYHRTSPWVTPKCTAWFAKRFVSSVNPRFVKSTGRRWRIVVPGVGFSLLAATQWNYLHKHGYRIDVEDRPELLNDFMVTDGRPRL